MVPKPSSASVLPRIVKPRVVGSSPRRMRPASSGIERAAARISANVCSAGDTGDLLLPVVIAMPRAVQAATSIWWVVRASWLTIFSVGRRSISAALTGVRSRISTSASAPASCAASAAGSTGDSVNTLTSWPASFEKQPRLRTRSWWSCGMAIFMDGRMPVDAVGTPIIAARHPVDGRRALA